MSAKTNHALVFTTSEGQPPSLVKKTIPMPTPGDKQVLVKILYVAQNPTDVQSFDSAAFGHGAVLGCDFVGIVEEIGAGVTRLAKGDVVAALIWGGEIKGLGAYSQYTVADERISFKVPAGTSYAQASTVPLALATSWLALFSKGCLNIDRTKEPGSILVWGGSSSVGLYAIQIAAMYGFNIVTTCSPRNADLVRSHGAKHVFDYRDANIAQKIKQVAPNLHYVFDTIGSADSSATASQALSNSNGQGYLCTVRPGKANTENVAPQTEVSDVLVWTAFLKDHRYGEFYWPASKEDYELACELFDKLPAWLSDGTIKPNTPKILKGLDAVPEGFEEHRMGKVSAYKIVYEL